MVAFFFGERIPLITFTSTTCASQPESTQGFKEWQARVEELGKEHNWWVDECSDGAEFECLVKEFELAHQRAVEAGEARRKFLDESRKEQGE